MNLKFTLQVNTIKMSKYSIDMAAAGAGGGAAAGAGGGMAPAAAGVPEHSIGIVKEFIKLIRPRPHESDLSDPAVHNFLREISAPFFSNEIANGLYERIPFLPPAKHGALRAAAGVGEGSYGQIYFCALRPNICYKAITIRPYAPQIEFTRWISGCLKEAFIQYFISSDVPLGIVVPAIIGIYRTRVYLADHTERDAIVIEMERGFMDVYNYLNRRAEISYDLFASITRGIFSYMARLYARFRFVHRDFKLNNILIKSLADGSFSYKIIDFGMACMQLNIQGTTYSIVVNSGKYNHDAPCRPQQDVLLYLIFYYQLLGDKSERRVRVFIRDLVPSPVKRAIEHRQTSLFHAAYNKDGSLLANADHQAALTIENLLASL